jgi:hypothetical protein
MALWDKWRMPRSRPTRYRAYRREARAAPDGSSSSGLPTWAALTIALAGIAATLIGSLLAAKITGNDQRNQQKAALAAQAADSDRKELRAVIDDAAVAVLRAQRDLQSAAQAVQLQRANLASLRDRDLAALFPPRTRRSDHARVKHRYQVFVDHFKSVDRAETRLLLRLGEHPLNDAINQVHYAFVTAERCLRWAQALEGATAGPPELPNASTRDVDWAVEIFDAQAIDLARSRLEPESTESPTPPRGRRPSNVGTPGALKHPWVRRRVRDLKNRIDEHRRLCRP